MLLALSTFGVEYSFRRINFISRSTQVILISLNTREKIVWSYNRNCLENIGGSMVSQELLEILRCPNCVREKDGLLDYYKESWLICQDCDRKYPIRDDIPVMLIDEGDKWINTPREDLPVPAPEK
jgi:uncharacterized protein YbaR (Trm112 family)